MEQKKRALKRKKELAENALMVHITLMSSANKTAKTFWETSANGKVRRLVREWYVAGRCVGFEVVTTRNVGWV